MGLLKNKLMWIIIGIGAVLGVGLFLILNNTICEHCYNAGIVTKAPSCTEEGIREVTCEKCHKTKELTISKSDHDFGDWVTTKEATFEEKGVEERKCKVCGETETKEIDILIPFYKITIIDENGEKIVNVTESGLYKLPNPEKIGYEFSKWVDNSGNEILSNGQITEDITIYPVWEIADTDTIEKLEERACAGVDFIKITKDIEIDRTIYISANTNIYSEKLVTLKRASSFAGDLFVVGQDKNGNNVILENNQAILTLGKEDAQDTLLVIDGNANNMTVDVNGTALFIVNSGIVNMYDDTKISNHKKVSNERTYDWSQFMSYPDSVGGSAVIVVNGVFNMYGGYIENNSVNTTQANEEESEDSSLGGAIYNYGNFYMYGGSICNNSAVRGGGIYNYKITKIYGGNISGNTASSAGAICMAGSLMSEMYIGSDKTLEDNEYEVIFKDNVSQDKGGAIVSSANSPVIIRNALFEGNRCEQGRGGVVYTSGTLTIQNSKLLNNYALENGGAIYHYYSNEDLAVRILEVSNTIFAGNSAGKGGAVSLGSASYITTAGTKAIFNNCQFTSNKAIATIETDENGDQTILNGNGGAIYLTKKSLTTINNSIFMTNEAGNLGGAITATSSSSVTIDNSTFTSNKSFGSGGAVSIYNQTTLALDNSIFAGNSSTNGNGGAIYISEVISNFSGLTFNNNSAVNGGAIAMYSASEITIDSILAYSNTATSYGGVFYNSKSTLKLIEGDNKSIILGSVSNSELKNTALKGGVIYAASDTTIELDGALVANNTSDNNGGAIYLQGNSNAKITNSDFLYNSSNNGGAIYCEDTVNLILNVITFENNSSAYGGGVSANGSSIVKASSITATNNTTTNCGGVFYVHTATFDIDTSEFTNNSSNRGGFIYASTNSQITITSSTISQNNAYNGGAIYASKNKNLNITDTIFKENSTTGNGGAIYSVGANIDLSENSNFNKNSSTSYGGAIYICPTDTDDNGNKIISVCNINGILFAENQALYGGAIYSSTSSLNITDVTFNANKATGESYGGGAIYTNSSNISTLDEVTFIKNEANNGGAVALYSGSEMNITSIKASENIATGSGGVFYNSKSTLKIETKENGTSLFELNQAANGGAICAGTTAKVTIKNVTFEKNTSTNNGGAIHASYSSESNVTNSTFTNNNSAYGGAISINESASIIIENSSINTNTGNYGAGIYSNDANVTLKNIELKENSASITGSALSIQGTSVLNANTITMIGNTAVNNGGGIYIHTASAELDDLTATNNDATKGGFAYASTNSSLTIKNSTINSNTATSGGSIYASKGKSLILNNTTFSENNAENGGAIYAAGATIETIQAIFTSNKATADGGAIYILNNTSLSLDSSEFNSNSAVNGGGITVVGSIINVSNNSKFSKNTSTKYGGAIYTTSSEDETISSTLTINSASFEENTADYGGALFLNSSSITINKTTFNLNTATTTNDTYGGGAIYSTVTTGTLDEIIFTNNNAHDGGAMALYNSSEITFTSLIATGNTSTTRGGVFYVSKSTLNLEVKEGGEITLGSATDASLKNSSANGGAIYLATSAVLSAKGVTFGNNEATTSDGGAVYVANRITDEEKVVFADCSFIGNKTADSGGAIYIVSASNVVLTNVVAKSNEAVYGGVVFITSANSHLTINSMTISENTASKSAPCIHSNNDATVIKINKTKFVDLDNETLDWSNLIKGKTAGVVEIS